MPDVAAASIKLEGCTSASLDSYLRGLGVVRLAARHARSARFSWSDDGCLLLAAGDLSVLIEELVQRATHEGAELTEPIASPWRGSRSSGPFEELRGEVDESLLAWFDACSVARFEGAEAKRVNNPLLGQGGGFGRAEIEPALEEALERLAALHEQPDVLLRGLEGTLLGRPIDRRVARRLGVAKKVLGAYQSGRATGPGGSRRDVDPSGQSAPTSAWDLVLALEGVRALRGSNTRRSGGGRVQASFPLLVRSRAIDVSGGPRDDDGRTYEFLAPMWSAPARPAAILHLLGAFRLRVGGRPAGDTLDALVSHATARAVEVGFDRLVRFALVAPSDPRYQYAVRRGTSTARGSRAAAVIAEELLPFLHRAGGWSPDEHVSAGLRHARRRVDDLVVAASRDEDTNAVIDLLGALVELEQRLARRTGPPRLATIGGRWWGLVARADACWLGAALAWCGTVESGNDKAPGRDSIGRLALMPHGYRNGRRQLDPTRGKPDLVRSSRRLDALAGVLVSELIRSDPARLGPGARAPGLRDLGELLCGSVAVDALCAATIAAARIDDAPRARAPRDDPTPASVGIGACLAALLLAPYVVDAANGEEHDQPMEVLTRKARLAALALGGDRMTLSRTADRMLAPAGLARRPAGDRSLELVEPARLALGLLVPLDREQRRALAAPLRIENQPDRQGEKQ